MVNAAGDEYSVQFAVISGAEEATLRERLMMCEPQAGLKRSICRAYYFRQIGLHTEAADEYDSASTTLAPNSVDLKLHAIAALRQNRQL